MHFRAILQGFVLPHRTIFQLHETSTRVTKCLSGEETSWLSPKLAYIETGKDLSKNLSEKELNTRFYEEGTAYIASFRFSASRIVGSVACAAVLIINARSG